MALLASPTLPCLLYLVGTFGVTIIGNVPLNYALDVTQPNTSEAADLWTRYRPSGPFGITCEP